MLNSAFFSRQPTFLAPEISYFNTIKDGSKQQDFYVKVTQNICCIAHCCNNEKYVPHVNDKYF